MVNQRDHTCLVSQSFENAAAYYNMYPPRVIAFIFMKVVEHVLFELYNKNELSPQASRLEFLETFQELLNLDCDRQVTTPVYDRTTLSNLELATRQPKITSEVPNSKKKFKYK